MIVKKTLKVGKKNEISTTIKKEEPIKKSVSTKRVGAKRSEQSLTKFGLEQAAEKTSAKTSPMKAKQDASPKKRVAKASGKKVDAKKEGIFVSPE